MSKFKYLSLCILGRQPALGLAELESLYGPQHIKPLEGAALLDVPAEQINFKQLGGTIKVARVLAELPYSDWQSLSGYLIENVPGHMQHQPPGKFTLGLSLYGLDVPLKRVEAALLEVKKNIRKSGKPARIVPNKAAALNSAQVLHNKLTHRGAWELIYIKYGNKTLLAQTMFVQDIEAYAARDQARPARDSRAGMLPPKLAQIIINLAAGLPEARVDKHWDSGDGLHRFLVLDPFCGTGVILQEALLMGYSVYGTDIEPKMVQASQTNIKWLIGHHPQTEGRVMIERADATSYQWPGFSCVASELYLGRPLNSLPPPDKLKSIIADTNLIIKKFLRNLSPQLKPGRNICLAVPAWRKPGGGLIRLPLIDQLTDMGYTYLDLKHVRREELIYFREDQVVARQLLRLTKQADE
jgi:tRNA G10  N-methylase Trm11